MFNSNLKLVAVLMLEKPKFTVFLYAHVIFLWSSQMILFKGNTLVKLNKMHSNLNSYRFKMYSVITGNTSTAVVTNGTNI